jgi:hypothetical protein
MSVAAKYAMVCDEKRELIRTGDTILQLPTQKSSRYNISVAAQLSSTLGQLYYIYIAFGNQRLSDGSSDRPTSTENIRYGCYMAR